MEDEEVSNDNIEPKYDRTFHTGMIVKIAENTLKTATGIDIPDDWYTLLFSVNISILSPWPMSLKYTYILELKLGFMNKYTIYNKSIKNKRLFSLIDDIKIK